MSKKTIGLGSAGSAMAGGCARSATPSVEEADDVSTQVGEIGVGTKRNSTVSQQLCRKPGFGGRLRHRDAEGKIASRAKATYSTVGKVEDERDVQALQGPTPNAIGTWHWGKYSTVRAMAAEQARRSQHQSKGDNSTRLRFIHCSSLCIRGSANAAYQVHEAGCWR